MPEPGIRRYVRRVAKGVWWAATPWRMSRRLQYLRQRAAAEARQAEQAALTERERDRAAQRARGEPVAPAAPLDLCDDAQVAQAVGLPWSDLSWPPVAASAIADRWSAARFCIDLLRRRPDTRERFPDAGSAGADGAFARWLRGPGAVELGLAAPALAHLLDALGAGLADRARQSFLALEMPRAVLPHGLTPAGLRHALRWFMRYGRHDAGLRLEEVWWLFLEATSDPVRELMLAHAFTPAWQERHPDGLTVFGREAFAAWFAEDYGASGAWLQAADWPQWQAPALQVRTAWQARAAWRAAHPRALQDEAAARALLGWLGSGAGLRPDAAQALRAFDADAVARELARPGVNVIGHFCYPSGLRVSAESMVEALGLAGVDTLLRDVRTDAQDEPFHARYRDLESHDITIIHTQPEPFFDTAYRRADLCERSPRSYRIAYWYWEFDTIPESWVAHARQVDEVWAATEFVARGLRERLALPVRTLFPGVKLAPYQRRDKAYFGLDGTRFTFLFTFHMMSVMERKNPLGLIRAFRQAFRNDEPVQLVLKLSFGDRHPAQARALREAAAGAHITVIDQVYSPDEVLSLMDACDAYVSLHRSEGLGLTMAEAMLMGKPVIATDFSGNVDFMNADNSLLVPCELVKLGQPVPPYDAELEWAEPSTDAAARLMRRVHDEPDWARALAARGQASARADLSLEAAGRRMLARLREIEALRQARA